MGLYSAAKAAIDQFNSDYATINLKFDYRKKNDTTEVNRSIFNAIKNLISKPAKAELFEVLTVKAEDEEKNNKLEVFDLLVNKVKSIINVEKQPRYRTVISEDLYQKIQSEIIRKKI